MDMDAIDKIDGEPEPVHSEYDEEPMLSKDKVSDSFYSDIETDNADAKEEPEKIDDDDYDNDDEPTMVDENEEEEDDSDLAPEPTAIIKVEQPKLPVFVGEYGIYAGKLYKEIVGPDSRRYWHLAQLSHDGPREYNLDVSTIVPPRTYEWRIGANGLPMPIFIGARIKCSKYGYKGKNVNSTSSRRSSTNSLATSSSILNISAISPAADSTSKSRSAMHPRTSKDRIQKHRRREKNYDFFFDSNGDILNANGDKINYLWHLFSLKHSPISWKHANVEPAKMTFSFDGTIRNEMGKEQNFKWMYILPGGFVIDPGFELRAPLSSAADNDYGTIGQRLKRNAIGAPLIDKFGKPLLILEEDLDTFGSVAQKMFIINHDSLIDVAEKTDFHHSGFNVKTDKYGNTIAGEPIVLEMDDPPVLLIKYTTIRQGKESPLDDPNNIVSFLPFWIIDPDGNLIVLHDKNGMLWDHDHKPYKPTGSGKEPDGDHYEYYLFSANKCDGRAVCMHPEILDSEGEEDGEGHGDHRQIHVVPKEEHLTHTLDIDKIRKLFKHHHSGGKHKPHQPLDKSFQFPKCIKDGSYQRYLKSKCIRHRPRSRSIKIKSKKNVLPKPSKLHTAHTENSENTKTRGKKIIEVYTDHVVI